tara:strand:+ start:196 stop:474 length:279 start_codon:yes stop_codon:yes gene_type:complete
VQDWKDGRYAIVTTGKRPDFEIIHEDSLKVMRTRFLLLRDFYYKCLAGEKLIHPNRQKVIVWYFGGRVHIPQVLIDQYHAEEQEGETQSDKS